MPKCRFIAFKALIRDEQNSKFEHYIRREQIKSTVIKFGLVKLVLYFKYFKTLLIITSIYP